MRLHEIAIYADAYLLTDFLIDELFWSVGNIRLSAAGCSRRQPAASRGTVGTVPRPAARLLPDCCPTAARQKPGHSLGLPDLPDLSWNRDFFFW